MISILFNINYSKTNYCAYVYGLSFNLCCTGTDVRIISDTLWMWQYNFFLKYRIRVPLYNILLNIYIILKYYMKVTKKIKRVQ
jgi:hypothetical protein